MTLKEVSSAYQNCIYLIKNNLLLTVTHALLNCVGLTMPGLKLNPPLTPGVNVPDRATLSGKPALVGR